VRISIPEESYTAEQRAIVEETVAGARGHVPAPLLAWLASPELGRRAQHLGEFIRYKTSLPPRLSELAILVTARHWTAQFEWYAHKKEALRGGLSAEIIDDIAARRPPRFKAPDEELVYRFAHAVHERHGVDDALYRECVTAFGDVGVVDLVGLLGYYTLVAMTLNTFEIGVPHGEKEELPP
jgi:4-carboxymuconolactone decarboxylase